MGIVTSESHSVNTPFALKPSDRKFTYLLDRMKTTGELPNAEELQEVDGLRNELVQLVVAWQLGKDDFDKTLQALINRNHRLAAVMATATTPDNEDPRFEIGQNGQKIIKLVSVEDIYALPDPEHLITKIIETATVSLLYGVSGTGKTFTALNLGLSVAHGIHWNGRKVKQGLVWYVNAEGGRNLKKRLQAWYKEHTPLLVPDPNFKIIPWALDLREHAQFLLDTIENQKEKPILIIIDNFSMCAPGVNQNLQEEVAPVLRKLNQLAQDIGPHVMLIHHTNKAGDANGTMAFRNHVDTMIELRKEDPADKQSAIIIASQKARDDEPFRDIKTELKQVDLYMDADSLEPVTSCVPIFSEAPVKQPGLKDVPQNALDILGDEVLSYTAWKKAVMEALHISKPTFDRARDDLLAKGYIAKRKMDGERYEGYARKAEETAPAENTSAEESEATHDY